MTRPLPLTGVVLAALVALAAWGAAPAGASELITLLDDDPEAVFLDGTETVPDSWVLAPATGSTPKSDITEAWLTLESPTLYAGLTQAKPGGSAFAGLELNRRAPGYRVSGGIPVPTRSEGDRLVALALGPRGLEAGLCTWSGDEHSGAWLPAEPAAPSAGMTGCSSAGVVAGQTDGAIDAALSLAPPAPPACFAWLHTRSAQPVGSAPRDLTRTVPLPEAPGCTAPPPPPPPPPDPGLPAPEAGRSVNVYPSNGRVRYRKRGGGMRMLGRGEQIPVGSLVDASEGEVRLVSSRGTAGGRQAGYFTGAAFVIEQRRGRRVVTELVLAGDAPGAARAAAKGKRPRLFGSAKGRFRTKGKHAAATVRGTRWLVEELPFGTRVKVLEGVVSVHDYVRPWTVLVAAGESYVARRDPPRPRKRRARR